MEIESTGTVETTNLDTANTDAFLEGLNVSETYTTDTEFDDAEGSNKPAINEDAPKPEDTAREYPIKYKGKEQTVRRTDAELIADIQKAMDYENVKQERDALKAAAGDSDDYKKALKFWGAENGLSESEALAYFRERMSDESQMNELRVEFPDTPDNALQAILEARRAQKANEEAKAAEAAETAHLNELLEEVKAEYPDFDLDTVADEVKELMEQGYTPLQAMIRHERNTLRKEKAEAQAERAAKEKEKENRQRSVGGYKNTGSDGGRNPFLEGLLGGG